ncbi:MAG: IS1096 element passenger TnpR family protein [Syntrophomonadaceae bacterium]
MDHVPFSSPPRPVSDAARVPTPALCLRVDLLDAAPPVWRRLRVSARMTLRRLHGVLCCALGRTDVESHRFRVGEVVYGHTADGLPSRDSRWATLGEIVAQGIRSFGYELGAPGTAVHEVRVEAILEGGADGDGRVECLAGEGVSPGDAAGADGSHDRVAFIVTDVFDGFDVDAVNRALARLGLPVGRA